MLDFYNFVENNPNFRQFAVDDLLFTAYDCPIEGSPVDYFVEKNYFCYVIKGGARWKTPKADYILKIGDAAFLKKGAHRVYKILTGEFCALLIFIPDEFIRAVLLEERPLNLTKTEIRHTDEVIPLVLDQSLLDYFNAVLNYFKQERPPAKSLLKVKFRELLINIATSPYNADTAAYFKEVCSGRKKSLKAVMEENFVYNLKLAEFARISGRSLATFNRDFNKIYDTSPGKWLKRKRLEYAKFLLETTNMNINEISLSTGFENTSHFIKTFRANFGYAPLKFKKLLQQS